MRECRKVLAIGFLSRSVWHTAHATKFVAGAIAISAIWTNFRIGIGDQRLRYGIASVFRLDFGGIDFGYQALRSFEGGGYCFRIWLSAAQFGLEFTVELFHLRDAVGPALASALAL
jgi:hypothetical protein